MRVRTRTPGYEYPLGWTVLLAPAVWHSDYAVSEPGASGMPAAAVNGVRSRS